jgi:hypothetical protein
MRFLPASAWVVLLFLCLHAGAATGRAQTLSDADVLAADEKRVAAMIAKDAAAVSAVLSDSLVYGHADGRVQTKEQLLAALAANTMEYRSIHYKSREVRALGTARGLSGVATLQVVSSGSPLEFTLRFLAVYVPEGGAWRLAAYQSVQILPASK